MQVELLRFRKKNVDFIHVYVCEPSDSMFTAYSLDGSTHRLTALNVNTNYVCINKCCLHVGLLMWNDCMNAFRRSRSTRNHE